MKPTKITNEEGDTIEIKCDDDGVIKIRHSDIDPKSWGELHEYAKRLSQPEVRSFFESKGVDIKSSETKEMAQFMGGYMVLRGETYIINAQEIAMIYEAVKQAGGIIPNWSNRP